MIIIFKITTKFQLFSLIVSSANYFRARKCSLCQAQASAHKHQKALLQKFSIRRKNFRQKNVIPSLMHKVFRYQKHRRVPVRNFLVLTEKKLIKSCDTRVSHSFLILQTFRNTKTASSRIISWRQSFRQLFVMPQRMVHQVDEPRPLWRVLRWFYFPSISFPKTKYSLQLCIFSRICYCHANCANVTQTVRMSPVAHLITSCIRYTSRVTVDS